MKREEAERLLELVPGEAISVRAVRAAFARRVKAAHPDTELQRVASLTRQFQLTVGAHKSTVNALQTARDVLLEHLAGENSACVLCRGTGMVRSKLGQKQCVACNGTGDKFK